MNSSRSTMLGVVALLVMAVGLLAYRAHLVAQRDAGVKPLQAMVRQLDAYAAQHHGALPADIDTLVKTVGPRAHDYTGPALRDEPVPTWKRGTPRPYLWDIEPHPFIGGVHVLYSDGTVKLDEQAPDTFQR